jgi:hypothetical protein
MKYYAIHSHEEDVLRQLRGLTEEQYDAILRQMSQCRRPVSAPLGFVEAPPLPVGMVQRTISA